MLLRGSLGSEIDNTVATVYGYEYSGKRNAFYAFFLNKKDGNLYYADLAEANAITRMEQDEIMIFPAKLEDNGEAEVIDWGRDVYCAYPEEVNSQTLLDHIYKFIEKGCSSLSREEWMRKLIAEGYPLI